VVPLARVDTRPQLGHGFVLAHASLRSSAVHIRARGTPRRHLRKQRPERRSQSAAGAPRRTGRPLLGSHRRQAIISHTRPFRADQHLKEQS
jgi:hypothetical protein